MKSVYLFPQGDWVDDERCGEGELTYNTGEVYRGKWSEDKQSMYVHLYQVHDHIMLTPPPWTPY